MGCCSSKSDATAPAPQPATGVEYHPPTLPEEEKNSVYDTDDEQSDDEQSEPEPIMPPAEEVEEVESPSEVYQTLKTQLIDRFCDLDRDDTTTRFTVFRTLLTYDLDRDELRRLISTLMKVNGTIKRWLPEFACDLVRREEWELLERLRTVFRYGPLKLFDMMNADDRRHEEASRYTDYMLATYQPSIKVEM